MYWFHKSFPIGMSWDADQDKFGKLKLAVAAMGGDEYRKMTMAVRRDDRIETVYVGFTRQDLVQGFTGYAPVEGSLPKMTGLLVGDASIWPSLIEVEVPYNAHE
ncbi:MAG: hypothetical protein CTY31_13245 [Hyphomicrobium sp.]|nr:MAG: hypothetical protein CTY39_11210 [Hyphomicrobium sp.]PPC98529.1 MAG: hypothetical protein CTY31_13245 [Hyphomicrobium sp.]